MRVRALGGFGDGDRGVALMNLAFATDKGRTAGAGPLTDTGSERGEQDATRFLFAGAYGVLCNPAGHRDVDYEDVTEAAEAVLVASMLMRILDRIERRLGDAG